MNLSLPPRPPTPQFDALDACDDARRYLLDFLEWLRDQRMSIGRYSPHVPFSPIDESTDSLLMRYLSIDAKALEKERRALLEWARSISPR